MPFADELTPGGVHVVDSRASWRTEGPALAAELAQTVPSAVVVEHIGSTAVPGLSAKDCLDVMIVVRDLAASDAAPLLSARGYRQRPEAWNTSESAAGRSWPKLVFAPPVGARTCNVHVRAADSGAARVALLFRDHLRARPDLVSVWSQFKRSASQRPTSLAEYGQLKYPAWLLLMELAEGWAQQTGWQPPWTH